jgi:hypothetical protein
MRLPEIRAIASPEAFWFFWLAAKFFEPYFAMKNSNASAVNTPAPTQATQQICAGTQTTRSLE